MDFLPTYLISYYNACKWLLIALGSDLSISITADRFEPSIKVLLLLLVLSLVAASAILASPKSSSSNISIKLLNLLHNLHFLKCVLTLSIFKLIS